MDKSAVNRGLALFALGCAGGTIYIIPYLRYVFYDKLINVMQITNAELGTLLIGFSIAAIILLFFGGALADKFSSKMLIQLSLLGTTVLTVVFALTLNYHIALVIWVGLAVTTGFVFWPALMKAISRVGTPEKMGSMYGYYYAINGIIAAVFNAAAVYVAAQFADPHDSLLWAVIVVASSTFFAMIMMHFFYTDDVGEAAEIKPEDRFQWKDFPVVLKSPYTWLFGLVGFCCYTAYSSNSYFTPYLTAVQGVEPEASEVLAIIRTYIFMFLAIVGGLIADRLLKSTAKYLALIFAAMVILYIGLFVLPLDAGSASLYCFIPAALTMSMYGIRYSVLREMPIKPQYMGTTIGMAAVISWSVDLFTPTMLGSWLDKWGNQGYNYIFMYLAGVVLLGVVITVFVSRKHELRKKQAQAD